MRGITGSISSVSYTHLDVYKRQQMSSDALDMMNKQYLSELLKYSLIIISSVPLMITYPFLQKYFIKGAMVGSVKG